MLQESYFKGHREGNVKFKGPNLGPLLQFSGTIKLQDTGMLINMLLSNFLAIRTLATPKCIFMATAKTQMKCHMMSYQSTALAF